MNKNRSRIAPDSIRGDAFELRRWEPRDAQALARVVAENVDHLGRWLPWARYEPVSIEDRRKLLERFGRAFDEGREFLYGIWDGEDLVGGAGLHRNESRPAEIGFWLAESAGGRGLATKASSLLIDVARDVLRLPRIEIRCQPANDASRKVAQRLGMKRVGVEPDSGIAADGSVCDLEVWQVAFESDGRSSHTPNNS